MIKRQRTAVFKAIDLTSSINWNSYHFFLNSISRTYNFGIKSHGTHLLIVQQIRVYDANGKICTENIIILNIMKRCLIIY